MQEEAGSIGEFDSRLNEPSEQHEGVADYEGEEQRDKQG